MTMLTEDELVAVRKLLEDSRQIEQDTLLTLREVADATQTKLETVRKWAYRDKTLPIEHVGPTRRVRVRASTVRRFFGKRVIKISVVV